MIFPSTKLKFWPFKISDDRLSLSSARLLGSVSKSKGENRCFRWMSRLNEISNVKRCLVALIKFSFCFRSITASRSTYWLIGIRLVWVWQSTRRNPSPDLCNKRWLQRRSFRETCFSFSKSMWFLFHDIDKWAPSILFLATHSITCKNKFAKELRSVSGNSMW